MLLEIDKKLSSVLSANRCYVEDSRGLTGWGTVVSPLRGKLPFLVAFCSLLRATAMQLPTLALFWIRARSVWHFLRKRENISMTGPTEAYVGNGLEGESRKCMLWDLIDLIPRSQNPVEQVCWITVLYEHAEVLSIHLPLCPWRVKLTSPFYRQKIEEKASQKTRWSA